VEILNYDKALVEPIANVLKSLGSKHVMVVHSKDGLDEISRHAEYFEFYLLI
jgi:anthranilate phosphoribosyltransferase